MFDESACASTSTSTTKATTGNTNLGNTTHNVKCRKLFHFSDDGDFIQDTQLLVNPAKADTQILESQDTIPETQIGEFTQNPAAADTHIPETQIGHTQILELQDTILETQIA